MSDLIDRQKAINVIERMRAYIGRNMERAVGAAFIEILDDVGEDIGRLPSIQFATDTNVGIKLSTDLAEVGTDCISRQAAIDTVHAMPGFEEIEKVIIDNLYVGDKKLTDLIASGRLRLVGFCKECKHCFPPLVCKVDGEVVQVTSDRCSICNGYVEKNGWCYKFEMRTDMRGEQDE